MAETVSLSDRVTQALETQLQGFRTAARSQMRFAFWHDVGVTGLGALATASLGVAEMSSDPVSAHAIRTFVLFLTGSVTVFAACNQFFKFRSKGELYLSTARRLEAIQQRLYLASPDGTSEDDLLVIAKQLEEIVATVDVVSPEDTVWGSSPLRGICIVAMLLIGCIATAEWLVGRDARAPEPPEAPAASR